MLLQGDDGKLHLLPAWPREWDVTFKLHAPGQSTVECTYRAGRIARLVSRHTDILLPEWQAAAPIAAEETQV